MKRSILVVADVRGGQLRHVTVEALGGAQAIADGGAIAAVLIGDGVRDMAGELARYGASEVLVADGPLYARYSPDAYIAALEAALERSRPQVVLFAHSAIGRDVAPMLAARHRAGQVSDVVDMAIEGDDVVFTRPIYAGKAFTRVKVVGDLIVATLRPNNLPTPVETPAAGTVVDLATGTTEADLRSVVAEVARKAAAGVDLTEAKIIVSGGRGVKSAEGFVPLRALADVLGAALGASRGACDGGYCDYSMQIGQTGKVVTPDLYIACGISGAIQHLAGMSNSKVIVAINKDPEAPIFKVADYGIVGDLFEVVPALTEEFRKVLGQ